MINTIKITTTTIIIINIIIIILLIIMKAIVIINLVTGGVPASKERPIQNAFPALPIPGQEDPINILVLLCAQNLDDTC